MFRDELFASVAMEALPGRPLIVDSFAGGGGASTGIEMALGRSPDIAINHNAAALALHAANHPETLHLSENIYKVDPLDHVAGKHVGLAHFSPDCKHFSKAKGGKPVERNIRDLAWVIVLWAERAKPDVITMENVEEWKDWGPLVQTDRGLMPDPERRGETFKDWLKAMRKHGYRRIEWRELRACDYGAPTIRKRLFLIARRDGKPIVWPEPTHGAPCQNLFGGQRRIRGLRPVAGAQQAIALAAQLGEAFRIRPRVDPGAGDGRKQHVLARARRDGLQRAIGPDINLARIGAGLDLDMDDTGLRRLAADDGAIRLGVGPRERHHCAPEMMRRPERI